MNKPEKREVVAEMLRHLRDLSEEDEEVASILDAAADRIEAREVDAELDDIVHDLPQPRWLQIMATVGGQHGLSDQDEPDRHIVMNLDLLLYGGQADALVAAIRVAQAADPEAQSVNLTLDAELNATWEEPCGDNRCRRRGPPLAPVLEQAIATAESFEPNDALQRIYET